MAGPTPQIVGRYAIYGKIASGGMASIHFGRLIGGAGFSRTVAIKRLHPHLAEDPDFLSTMIDEARLAARIHHPNVVPILDVVATDGELLLVLEYVRGESWARLMRTEAGRGKRIPLHVSSAVTIGALHGLHAAHEATNDQGMPLGIVHRDVSPQNILVGVDGLPRVIDFGVAKAAGRLQTTQDGTIKGKIAYMAPEQLGGGAVTRLADVYAMGAILWEALAGRKLFQADGDAALIARVMAGATDPPSRHTPGISPQLDQLVMRALARDPNARFPTARDMAESLTRLVPPSLPTDVGAWCADAAHDMLSKRGFLLAEIESNSGSVSASVSAPPSPLSDSGRHRRSGPPRVDAGHAEQDPSTIASQASSISTSTPVRPSSWRWAGISAGLGATLAIGIGVGMCSARGSSTSASAPPAESVGRVASTDVPPTPPASAAPEVASATPSVPLAVASSEPAPSATQEPSGASLPALPPPPPLPAPPPSPPPAVARPKPAAAAAKDPTSAKPAGCNPSYYFDANGNKHFKPECFGH